jgi:uroporphyrin-III C-methyltransferase/precorrin-2 dehydrogenase/sirohydrochlorin ferrochelatase/uroporphyrin-III C-methyltransferase
MNSTHQHKGKVILAGAGPGDPELVTLKLVRYLREADVVLTDRLVSKDILEHCIHKNTHIVYVGKQADKCGSTPQASINELLVGFALQGKLVVRLKGGDVSIFSNVLDELQELVKHKIPYEIIPGITSALGAAAYAGIPLTARGYATSVRFLTYYRTDAVTNNYWKELSQTDDTLVFYMSCENIESLVTNLVKNNIGAGKLMAVVEQATTPLQHVTVASLYEYDQKLRGKTFISPSLLIIGKVVALHEQFAWLGNSDSREFYFKPVAGQSKEIINNDKETEHIR